jgi:hypothetical protein
VTEVSRASRPSGLAARLACGRGRRERPSGAGAVKGGTAQQTAGPQLGAGSLLGCILLWRGPSSSLEHICEFQPRPCEATANATTLTNVARGSLAACY